LWIVNPSKKVSILVINWSPINLYAKQSVIISS